MLEQVRVSERLTLHASTSGVQWQGSSMRGACTGNCPGHLVAAG